MGRKSTPTNLKLAANNPGRRPINKNEFRPVAELPPAPKHLKGEAKREWDRIAIELAAYQMISAVDRGALAMLCTQWARYVQAEDMIAAAAAKEKDREKETGSVSTNGLATLSPNGYMVHSTALSVSNKAIEIYLRLCGEFGLTPSARTNLAPATSPQQTLPGFEPSVVGDAAPKKTLGSFSKPT
jgi:P27 family predicted phage terminase small subunit